MKALAYVNRHQCCVIQVFLRELEGTRRRDRLVDPSNSMETNSMRLESSHTINCVVGDFKG